MSEKRELKITTYLERKGFVEVLLATGYKGYTNWKDIVTFVIINRDGFSPSTIKKRLEDMVQIGFIKKQIKIKSRNEYTYHVTDLGKKYALSIQKMLKETEEINV